MNNDSREKNSMRNVSIGLFYQGISLVMNFLAKTVFIKVLGSVYLGVNGLFTNIFILFSFAEFGIGVAMVYSLYKPIYNKDIAKIRGLYSLFRKYYINITVIMTLIGLCIVPILPLIVKTEYKIDGLIIFYIVFLVNILIYNLFIYKTFLLVADQRKYILSIAQIVADVLGFTILMVVLLVFRSYLIYLIVLTLKTLSFALTSHILTKRYYPFIYEKGEKDVSKKEKVEIKKNIKDLFAYRVATVLVNSTDNIYISILVGIVWVGYYSNYDLIIMGISSVIAVIYSAVSSSVGNLIAEKDNEAAYEIFKMVQVISIWLSGMTVICLLILFKDFITLWIGEEYLLSETVVIIIVVNYYLSCVRDSMKIFRETLGIFNKVKYMMIATAVINLLLSFFLGRQFGLIGIFISTTIASVLTFYWYEPILICKAMNVKNKCRYFFIQGLGIVLLFVNLYITNFIVDSLSITGVLGFFVKAVICFIVCNLIYFAVLGRTKTVRYLLGMFGNYLKNKK